MQKIFKYKLEMVNYQSILIPCDGKILSLQTQQNEPYMWILIDETYSSVRRFFELYNTGDTIKHNEIKDFIGTFQLQNGLVYHVFETFEI